MPLQIFYLRGNLEKKNKSGLVNLEQIQELLIGDPLVRILW